MGMAPVSVVYRVNHVSLAWLGFLILLYPVLAKQAEPQKGREDRIVTTATPNFK